MQVFYIGSQKYKIKYFRSPLGFIKFLIYVWISPAWTNCTEYNLPLETTAEEIRQFANAEIKRLESLQ